MATLSEWLQIMLGEIARKRDEQERASEEDARRGTEKVSESPPGATAEPATQRPHLTD